MRDLYEVLGVETDASQEEIKRKYRLLAKKYHPDLNQVDEESEQIFKEINLAYEVLGDADKRKQYDMYGDAIFQGGGANSYGGFGDFFSDLFAGFGFGDFGGMGRQRPRGPRAGGDVQFHLNLEFREAVFGAEKEINFERMERCTRCEGSGVEPGHSKETCPNCHGSGRVRQTKSTVFGQFISEEPCPTCNGTGEHITEECHQCHGEAFERKRKKVKLTVPAGVERGSILTLRGEGHHGDPGAPSGDLYVIIDVKEHPLFQRRGQDIFFELPITFTQAALGGELEVPTLRGVKPYEIPEGTQTGERFVMKGEGVQSPRGRGVGNLIFEVVVETPTKLSRRERELFEELAKESGEDIKKKRKTFLNKVKDFLIRVSHEVF